MVNAAAIRAGMNVCGGDGEVIGQIEEVTPLGMRVTGGHLYPLSAIERIENECVYFHNPAAQYRAQTGPQSVEAQRDLDHEIEDHQAPVPGAAGPHD